MRDDTEKRAKEMLLQALLAAPLDVETDKYELAGLCEQLIQNEYGEFELVAPDGTRDEVWLDYILEDLYGLVEARGIHLEAVENDRFVPRRLVRPHELDLSMVEEVRLSCSVFGPGDCCTRIKCADGRIVVAQGHFFEEVIASVTAGARELEKVHEALAYAKVRDWERVYQSSIDDGEWWDLLIRLRDGSVFVSEGYNAWPDGFDGVFQNLIMTTLNAPLREGDFVNNSELCRRLRIAL